MARLHHEEGNIQKRTGGSGFSFNPYWQPAPRLFPAPFVTSNPIVWHEEPESTSVDYDGDIYADEDYTQEEIDRAIAEIYEIFGRPA